MKIGIMTFHWATNYGAVLQAYCLQEYLREQGHEVEIINYKPKQYDGSFLKFIRNRDNWIRLSTYSKIKKKEQLLSLFREKYLNCTSRFIRVNKLTDFASKYDVLISGSDQILNPSFTMYGEDSHPSNAYYLGFASNHSIKIGYAVSFGCIEYPNYARIQASTWIQNFDKIGTRENTGLNILNQLKYTGISKLVPDPTILYGSHLYSNVGVDILRNREEYTCVYMLRHELSLKGKVKVIDEKQTPITMEDWLTTISHSRALVTNSYHGMIMAILAHVPFVVLLENGKNAGMNDRFTTLLNIVGLTSRITNEQSRIEELINTPIEWSAVEEKLSSFREIGKRLLDI